MLSAARRVVLPVKPCGWFNRQAADLMVMGIKLLATNSGAAQGRSNQKAVPRISSKLYHTPMRRLLPANGAELLALGRRALQAIRNFGQTIIQVPVRSLRAQTTREVLCDPSPSR